MKNRVFGDFGGYPALRVPPGGNQVDGLPSALSKLYESLLGAAGVSPTSHCSSKGRVLPLYESLLEAGGKPSTWFPPEGLVELTGCARFMGRLSNDFLLRNIKFSETSKNIIFLKVYKKLPVTFNLTLIEQINK